MPKKVDLTKRKNQIAAATWRVILNQGIDKASIQSIAKETNMSVGLIQHYFSSKEKIIHYAMNLVLTRMEERAKARLEAFSGTKEASLRRLIKFLIPTDYEEIMEARVWISFMGISFNNSELLTLQKKMDGYSREILQMIIEVMVDLGYLEENEENQFELEILYAFIDGMIIHTLQNPEFYTEKKVDQLIEHYLMNKKGNK
ncbi:TetR/AcrR family transcriptional regulator [Salirhabdus sp. Marseille-P4669]|uniref:TetR/AcrR family transcriptional regulator n=1 Tax=Salirhabdus sp. Marseille-P4669 TaxID=2042310 RepID=UPI000C7E1B5E|nr:TetR/AcrR family transcriptional regulator [Salirhabdus sp. Marseille-P4669]